MCDFLDAHVKVTAPVFHLRAAFVEAASPVNLVKFGNLVIALKELCKTLAQTFCGFFKGAYLSRHRSTSRGGDEAKKNHSDLHCVG